MAWAHCSQFNNQQVGELWVSYSVKLSKPKLAVSLGRTIQEDRFIANGGTSNTSILGTQLLKLKQNNIGVELSETSSGSGSVNVKFTFPNFLTGVFEIIVFKQGDATTSGVSTYAGNVSAVDDYAIGGSYESGFAAGSLGVNSMVLRRVQVRPATAGVDNTVTLPFTAVTSGNCSVTVRRYNPDISFNQWESTIDGSTVVP